MFICGESESEAEAESDSESESEPKPKPKQVYCIVNLFIVCWLIPCFVYPIHMSTPSIFSSVLPYDIHHKQWSGVCTVQSTLKGVRRDIGIKKTFREPVKNF